MFKKNCRIRNCLTNVLVKAYNFLPNVRKGGAGKCVLNNVKKTARLVKRGIPYQSKLVNYRLFELFSCSIVEEEEEEKMLLFVACNK